MYLRNNQSLIWICSRRSTTSWCLCYQSYDQWLLAEKISFTSNTCKATLPMQHFSWRCCMPRRDNLSLEVIILIHILFISYSYLIHILFIYLGEAKLLRCLGRLTILRRETLLEWWGWSTTVNLMRTLRKTRVQ